MICKGDKVDFVMYKQPCGKTLRGVVKHIPDQPGDSWTIGTKDDGEYTFKEYCWIRKQTYTERPRRRFDD